MERSQLFSIRRPTADGPGGGLSSPETRDDTAHGSHLHMDSVRPGEGNRSSLIFERLQLLLGEEAVETAAGRPGRFGDETCGTR